MLKKLEKVKTWMMEHKGQMICGGLMALAATVAATAAVKCRTSSVVLACTKPDEIRIPDSLKKYGVDDDGFTVYDGSVDVHTAFAGLDGNGYTISVNDLGEFGAALMEIPGVDEESKAFISISVEKNN